MIDRATRPFIGPLTDTGCRAALGLLTRWAVTRVGVAVCRARARPTPRAVTRVCGCGLGNPAISTTTALGHTTRVTSGTVITTTTSTTTGVTVTATSTVVVTGRCFSYCNWDRNVELRYICKNIYNKQPNFHWICSHSTTADTFIKAFWVNEMC